VGTRDLCIEIFPYFGNYRNPQNRMHPIRILAIEDEPIHAETLRMVIEELGYVLIEVANNIQEFQRLVIATVPDILLIDIDLGAELDGIELATKVRASQPVPIIFVTAYKDTKTILRATEASASAYITKPYEASSLQAAIEIAVARQATATSVNHRDALPFPKSIFVKHEGRLVKVNLDDIRCIEVKEKFCYIHTKTENLDVNVRLKELMDLLPASQFIQVHRSFIVAINHISELSPGQSTLKIDQQEIPIGKNYKDDVLHRVAKIG
jgi:DNA-binding LytR/AlgR family response regulator